MPQLCGFSATLCATRSLGVMHRVLPIGIPYGNIYAKIAITRRTASLKKMPTQSIWTCESGAFFSQTEKSISINNH